METQQSIISGLLKKVINDLDSGNCSLSAVESEMIIDCIRNATSPYISKYQTCECLNISRAKFDNLVRDGKIHKGIKRAGFTELFWNKNKLLEKVKNITKDK